MIEQVVASKKVKPIDCQHYINGQYVPSINGKTFENINPATKEVLGTVAEGGKEEIDLAVQAAKRALKGPWKKLSTDERIKVIRKIGDIILERKDELAMLETLDTGKPLSLASSLDIPRAAYNFHFFADYIRGIGTEAFETDSTAINYSVRRPTGVIGIINPWNLPLLLLTWKLAPALAMGNTVVIKPAELTPTTATLLGEICRDAGVPDGVVNIVHGFGPNSAGSALSEHPNIDAISFTGETTTGKIIMKSAAESLKKLSYELGGKNPNIIFADSDLDEVIETTLKSSFVNQGEVCMCGSRIYVERPVYDQFLEKFTAKAKELVVGDPLDSKTNVGALISEEHYNRVKSYIEIAKEEGGEILIGGKTPEELKDKGYYLEPTIIVGLDHNCRVVREEIFGPVVTVIPFDTEEEVIELANDTYYGLSASVWTNNLRRAHRVAGEIEAGIVWVNTWFLRDLRTPFGGTKQSGIGREGGAHGLEFYSELKNICIKL
ncbi:2-hydroxymuconic semialdehyde dehydrogenase [Schinkia azotoformans]|uniref:2-hydroxymuconic semialdehyde dehydrogenase n=1 Tax=Schinkia azotoformans TaxID=1454 RepID=UPI002DBF6FDF|nr:2-hydroxymuconic semialdehyde dehydrogenase [Schinkia azotoformans]MEC1714471.1 2-hydroxymuconic semialdehyde dehydrogenase [Schinkia azotoformans]MEC1740434.1 2-hydroxymuconic semialdehyde dehydrogenase [Schinkia azotoformans]MEC1745009.1 2-hydroxymuconic semialdehyde dehydrogenase [Schinkia azotoformans]MEC1756751.1 2-hydroxymuconic semialdehyde dehydrogenase [Schinkia azotoformans]MEC1768727.1 2-hydroxymuconic semialdehyde dehydrogenase [Schinkia azotoformans]